MVFEAKVLAHLRYHGDDTSFSPSHQAFIGPSEHSDLHPWPRVFSLPDTALLWVLGKVVKKWTTSASTILLPKFRLLWVHEIRRLGLVTSLLT